MRMFLVSDFPAVQGSDVIPICCYLPYKGDCPKESDWYKTGYFAIEDGYSINNPKLRLYYIYYDRIEIKVFDWKNDEFDEGLSRLVRPLTADELDAYKNNYLGYGSQPHKLTICHPDTYGSEGWLAN